LGTTGTRPAWPAFPELTMLILAIVLALLVIVVVVLAAGLIVRADRRRAARQGDWDTQALDACAAADALHDQLATTLMPIQLAGVDGHKAAGRWSDTERRLDQLSTRLNALRFAAPNYTTDQATEELIMALAALRSALQVQHGARAVASAPAGEPATAAQARLMQFDSAIRALKAMI
jgi:hypothetical protein